MRKLAKKTFIIAKLNMNGEELSFVEITVFLIAEKKKQQMNSICELNLGTYLNDRMKKVYFLLHEFVLVQRDRRLFFFPIIVRFAPPHSLNFWHFDFVSFSLFRQLFRLFFYYFTVVVGGVLSAVGVLILPQFSTLG